MFAALSAIVSLMGSHEGGGGSIIYNWLARHLDILHAGAAATLQFGSTAAPPPSLIDLFSKPEIKSKK
jgi:hypothetical protein